MSVRAHRDLGRFYHCAPSTRTELGGIQSSANILEEHKNLWLRWHRTCGRDNERMQRSNRENSLKIRRSCCRSDRPRLGEYPRVSESIPQETKNQLRELIRSLRCPDVSEVLREDHPQRVQSRTDHKAHPHSRPESSSRDSERHWECWHQIRVPGFRRIERDPSNDEPTFHQTRRNQASDPRPFRRHYRNRPR